MQRVSSSDHLDHVRKISPPVLGVSSGVASLKAMAVDLAAQLCKKGGAVPPNLLLCNKSRGISAMRKLLMPNRELESEKVNQKAKALQQRQAHIVLDNHYRLFEWPAIVPPACILNESALPFLPIPKPLQKAKLILANLYAKKYGIVILCEFEGTDSNNVIDLLIQRIQEHGQAPVGIVVPARSPSNWPKAKNFSGHVLPIVIQKTDSGFDLVNFDSLAENSFFYDELCAKFKERMALLGASSFRHILVKSQRQADQQSCHTDAMQILKDTLRLLKLKDNSNCIDTLMQLEPNNGMGASAHARFYLPSCLQKTTQRSAALRASSFDGTQSLQPERKAIFSSRKSLTIGQHRYKYTGAFESKEANHFLIIKAFYNAEKILKQLEAKPI